MPNHDDVLDANAAADYLKVTVQTIRRLARNKQVPAFRVGGAWRFRKKWLDDWAQRQHSGPRKKHVVAIDDESYILHIIERELADENFTISLALRGADALELMARHPPDLVILDLAMPDMDGPDTLARIRQAHGAVPVIVFTAYPDSELMQQTMESPPVLLLAKPPKHGQLRATVRALINHPPVVRG